MGSLLNSANNQLWILTDPCFKWIFFGILLLVQFSLDIFFAFDLIRFYDFNYHLWTSGFKYTKKNESKDKGLPYIYYNWLTSYKNINDCNKKT